jgi:hypothetical protein
LNAGKHVGCEKPLAVNAVEAQEIVDLARWLGPTGTKDGWVDEDSNQEDLCVCILIYIYCIYIYMRIYIYTIIYMNHCESNISGGGAPNYQDAVVYGDFLRALGDRT